MAMIELASSMASAVGDDCSASSMASAVGDDWVGFVDDVDCSASSMASAVGDD